MKQVDTIIIGGGVSGLACGHTLHKSGYDDFVLLSKDVGGRMLTSKTRMVDYGASYITEDYKNVWPFMGGRERIRIKDCFFRNGKNFTTFYCLKAFLALPKLIRLYFVLRDFRKRLNRLRERALHEPQKKIVDSDPVLKNHLRTSAKEFVKRYGLEELNEIFFNPLFNSTGFMEYDKANAFFFLDNLMPMLCKAYVADHRHCCKRLAKGWGDRIRKTIVLKVSKTKQGYKVKTRTTNYLAKNVVLALPYLDAKKMYPVPKPMHNIPVYVFHVVGRRKEPYKDKMVVFLRPKKHKISILWKQKTGSDIIFSKISDPKFELYYEHHRIIKKIYWKTGTVLSGRTWVKQDLDKGLYLASDYNICGLEDAFITGIYAANRILGKKS